MQYIFLFVDLLFKQVDPSLAPVLDRTDFDCHYLFREEVHCFFDHSVAPLAECLFWIDVGVLMS